jgi:pyruvyl transferase EpsO
MMTAVVRDQAIAALAAWIPRGSDVAIIDVPVHRNAGDLFILAATSRLLADLECRIVFRSGVLDYRQQAARRHIGRDTIIVGLGGGNFGDLYPRYQELRARIVGGFPKHRIVILPQSIHFEDPGQRERVARSFSAHPDLKIAVRDRVSFDIARTFTGDVMLLPDVVHAMGTSPTTQPRSIGIRGTVTLRRRDRESGGSLTKTDGKAVDWPQVFPDFLPRLAITAVLMPLAPQSLSARLHESWSVYAHALLARGLAWMADVDHLVTDRLHAAILARLAGRRVTLHDNASGKLAAYYDAWWREDPAVELMPDRLGDRRRAF